MKRPSLAVAIIVKNEYHNLPPLLESLRGCVDHIYITDTGSTDATLDLIEGWQESGNSPAGCPVTVKYFSWIDDFAAARNFSFDGIKEDYIMWIDADDALFNKERFIMWRDDLMGLADYHVAVYNYSIDNVGMPNCSFARERVVKNGLGLQWRYFIHEGIPPKSPYHQNIVVNQAVGWAINHRRTQDDINQDRSRNIRIIEKNKSNLDSRMLFYYGKELFENNQHVEAIAQLHEASIRHDLEPHDRILTVQYLSHAYMLANSFDKAINVALQGLHLDATRAEFHCMVGDGLLKKQRFFEAAPFYAAAVECEKFLHSGMHPIFQTPACYQEYPRTQLSNIYFNMGKIDEAKALAIDVKEKYKSQLADELLKAINKAQTETHKPAGSSVSKSEDIVITCPPQGAYLWDEDVYASKGVGGSETAAIEMSRWLTKLTGRRVLIFNPREDVKKYGNVEYHPGIKSFDYFREQEPKMHIQWRHATKLTNAKSYAWCHDLILPGAEQGHFDKVIALTPFHKRILMAQHGIAENKIFLSGNGVVSDRFMTPVEKNPNKIIFPSSGDRGADHAMTIVEKARKVLPDLELHMFYGWEDLDKWGHATLRDKLFKMAAARPWVKYHGKVQQDVLSQHMKESAIWLYPAVFIESYCITAIEALCSKTYPVVREIGALQDTLRDAAKNGMASLSYRDVRTELDQQYYADEIVKAVKEKRWESVVVNPEQYSWKNIAEQWCEEMGL